MHHDEEQPEAHPVLPHADFGAQNCDGCLIGVIRGGHASIECNECGAIVRIVAPADLQRTLNEMELSLVMCTEMCPHCRKVNVFPGFSEMLVYTCQRCGLAVEVGNP